MSHLQANLAQIAERFGNRHQIWLDMTAWHDARALGDRPRRPVPSNSTFYKLWERDEPPKSDSLRYLGFWLLHARAGRPFNVANWASAGVLAADMGRLPPDEFWRRHGAIERGIDTVARHSGEQVADAKKFHLVGIGALNIDSIVRIPDHYRARHDIGGHYDTGVEHVVSRSQFESKLESVSAFPIEESLGGSAFNVIQALSHAAPRLKLGYVGCLGEDRRSQFESWFEHRGVDHAFVVHDSAPTSASLSLIEGEERTLFTTEGDANDQLPRHLHNNYALVDYLTRARCIHISSIFDKAMPAQLLDVILAVKARSAAVKISFDPGWVWCERMENDPALQGLLKQADILFLNPMEFEKLAGSAKISEEEAARRILPRCAEEASVLVYKHPTRTSLYSWDHDGAFNHRRLAHRSLLASEIEDSTGAGDVLAAGILTHWLFDQIDYDHAMRLATDMVEIKLKSAGSTAFSKFEGLLRAIVESGEQSEA
jgi:sugar/nucleoside kinase (ribokinase family)